MALTLGELSRSAPSLELGPTMSGQAYRALRADILSGAIEPGTKLKMDELQARYHFSSSPLREALSRLAAEQIVTVDERRGFRAAPISSEDLNDITQFRLVIEIRAFEMSVERGGTQWEADVTSAQRQLEAHDVSHAAVTGSRDTTWTELHRRFHASLIGACGSSRLTASCSAMFDHSERYRSLSPIRRELPRDSGPEHRRLMDAAIRRDGSGGASLLAEHIMKTSEALAGYLAQSRD